MLIRLMEDFHVKIATFQHVLEGYKVADEIAKHGAGGSTFSDWWAYKFEVYDAIPFNGSLMRKRGINVSFNSDSDDLARRLYQEAAKAVKYGGTPELEALKFVTLNPAQQLHIDQRVGSLEAGKDADFVVWSRSPLDSATVCRQTWIDGKKYFDIDSASARAEALAKERAGLLAKAKKLASPIRNPTAARRAVRERTGSSAAPWNINMMAVSAIASTMNKRDPAMTPPRVRAFKAGLFSRKKVPPSPWPSPPRRGRRFSIAAEAPSFGDFFQFGSSVSAFQEPPVAQVGNLPCRRLAVGWRWERPEDCGLSIRDTADYQSALRYLGAMCAPCSGRSLPGEGAGVRARQLSNCMAAAKRRVFSRVGPACLLLWLFLFAADAPAETILLRNAIVHTVSGETLSAGDILIKEDKIEAVGASLTAPGARTIDLLGGHVYPGLIALDSGVGLGEIEAVRATQDSTEVGEYKPDVQSWIAVNPDSELIAVTRANGITHVEPAPQGGVVGGLSGLAALAGWTAEEMTIKHPTALHLYWPAMELDTTPKERFKDKSKFKSLEDQARERREQLRKLDDFFLEARAYAKAREAAAKGAATDPGLNPPWEAMLPVVRGEIPIMVHAAELRQIKAAIGWAQTNNYRIVIVDGRDAWRAAALLATNKIPVIYEAIFALPARDDDSYDVNFKAPEVLRKAGVTVAFSHGPQSMEAPMTRNLPYDAAQAIAFGLPENEALKGLTLYPAQMMGVGSRLGSLEPGKEATLFVCDGSIFDLRANVKRMWIAGREVSLENRHTRLYDKYKNRPLPVAK